MVTIDNNVMQKAAEILVTTTPTDVEVHTVTLITNGQHGGADLVIQGCREGGDLGLLEDYEHKAVLR